MDPANKALAFVLHQFIPYNILYRPYELIYYHSILRQMYPPIWHRKNNTMLPINFSVKVCKV